MPLSKLTIILLKNATNVNARVGLTENLIAAGRYEAAERVARGAVINER